MTDQHTYKFDKLAPAYDQEEVLQQTPPPKGHTTREDQLSGMAVVGTFTPTKNHHHHQGYPMLGHSDHELGMAEAAAHHLHMQSELMRY